MKPEVTYYAWASNNSGASMDVDHSRGTSQRKAEDAARALLARIDGEA